MLLVGPVTVFSFAFFWVPIVLHTEMCHTFTTMAPKAFSKDYLLDKLDELWFLRENMNNELDWSYECRLDQLTKKMRRQMIDPHEAEKQRQQYEFVYTTCIQNLETSHENLSVLQST